MSLLQEAAEQIVGDLCRADNGQFMSCAGDDGSGDQNDDGGGGFGPFDNGQGGPVTAVAEKERTKAPSDEEIRARFDKAATEMRNSVIPALTAHGFSFKPQQEGSVVHAVFEKDGMPSIEIAQDAFELLDPKDRMNFVVNVSQHMEYLPEMQKLSGNTIEWITFHADTKIDDFFQGGGFRTAAEAHTTGLAGITFYGLRHDLPLDVKGTFTHEVGHLVSLFGTEDIRGTSPYSILFPKELPPGDHETLKEGRKLWNSYDYAFNEAVKARFGSDGRLFGHPENRGGFTPYGSTNSAEDFAENFRLAHLPVREVNDPDELMIHSRIIRMFEPQNQMEDAITGFLVGQTEGAKGVPFHIRERMVDMNKLAGRELVRESFLNALDAWLKAHPNEFPGKAPKLKEANDCHEPAGSPTGGQFCSDGGGTATMREWTPHEAAMLLSTGGFQTWVGDRYIMTPRTPGFDHIPEKSRSFQKSLYEQAIVLNDGTGRSKTEKCQEPGGSFGPCMGHEVMNFRTADGKPLLVDNVVGDNGQVRVSVRQVPELVENINSTEPGTIINAHTHPIPASFSSTDVATGIAGNYKAIEVIDSAGTLYSIEFNRSLPRTVDGRRALAKDVQEEMRANFELRFGYFSVANEETITKHLEKPFSKLFGEPVKVIEGTHFTVKRGDDDQLQVMMSRTSINQEIDRQVRHGIIKDIAQKYGWTYTVSHPRPDFTYFGGLRERGGDRGRFGTLRPDADQRGRFSGSVLALIQEAMEVITGNLCREPAGSSIGGQYAACDSGGSDRADRGDQAPAGELQVSGGVRGGSGAVDVPAGSYHLAPPLKDLPATVKVDGKDVTFGPYAPARMAEEKYMRERGLSFNPPTTYVKVDPAKATAVANAYEEMKHDPHDPVVKAAYEALARETIEQYKAMLETGITIEFNPPGVEPYGNPRHAILDVVNNNHLYVFPTDGGFGTSADFDPSENPLLAKTEFMISGKPALVNDLFRAVHDFFGHIKEGNGFRADGEENAWRQHMPMFSRLAQRALTSETRGQNSWLNYGPYGAKNRTAKTADTVFADQKTGLMPEWTLESLLALFMSLLEGNDCHEPAGSPKGGQFCSAGPSGQTSDTVLPLSRTIDTDGYIRDDIPQRNPHGDGKVSFQGNMMPPWRDRAFDLAGGLPGTRVTILEQPDRPGNYLIKIDGTGINGNLNVQGSRVYFNELYVDHGTNLRAGAHPGDGVKIMAGSIKAARELGMTDFGLYAAGKPGEGEMNGYYTWARLGFEGFPGLAAISRAGDRFVLPRGTNTTVQDIMELGKNKHGETGAEWWQEHGIGFSAHFDLRDGSRSMKRLGAYMKLRFGSNPFGSVNEALLGTFVLVEHQTHGFRWWIQCSDLGTLPWDVRPV